MKTRCLLLLLAALVSVSFFSCSKDDNNNAKPDNAKIVGTWDAESGEMIMDVNGLKKDSTFDIENAAKITFNSNGTYTTSSIEDGTEQHSGGAYTLKGDTLYLTGDSDDDGDSTFVNMNQTPVGCKINGNKMTWSYTGNEEVQGIPFKFSVKIYLTKE